MVTETAACGGDRITALGKAKGTDDPVGVSQLERLEHIRGLLPATRVASLPKIMLFARSGFTGDLVSVAAGRPDIELVDLDRLYHGG